MPTGKKMSWADRLKKEPVVPTVKKMSWSDRVKKSAGEGADSAYGALEAKLSLGVNEVTTILMDRLKKESVGTSRVPTVRATVRSKKWGNPN